MASPLLDQYGKPIVKQGQGLRVNPLELAKDIGIEEGARNLYNKARAQGVPRSELAQIFKSGRTTGVYGPRMAGSPNMLQKSTALLGRSKVPLAGLALLGSLAAGAQEMGDGEGAGRNLTQAGFRAGADLATTAGAAALGTAILPGIGTVGLPILVNALGLNEAVGKGASGLGTGLYNIITGTTAEDAKDERARRKAEADAASQLGIDMNRLEGMGAGTLALAAKQAELNNSINKFNLGLQNEYNYANMLNQAALNQQQINANQSAQLAALLMN